MAARGAVAGATVMPGVTGVTGVAGVVVAVKEASVREAESGQAAVTS